MLYQLKPQRLPGCKPISATHPENSMFLLEHAFEATVRSKSLLDRAFEAIVRSKSLLKLAP